MYRFLYPWERFGNFPVLHYLIRTSGVESKDTRSWRQTAHRKIESERPRALFADNDQGLLIRWSAAGEPIQSS
jgi:hypothetical protein